MAAAAGWGRAAGLGLRVLLPKRRGVEICEAWGARHCTYRAHLFVTVQFLHRRHVKGSPSLSKAAKMAFISSLAVGSRFLRKRKRVFLTFHCDFENMEAGHTPSAALCLPWHKRLGIHIQRCVLRWGESVVLR